MINNKLNRQKAIIGTYYHLFKEAKDNCAPNEVILDWSNSFIVIKKSIAEKLL